MQRSAAARLGRPLPVAGLGRRVRVLLPSALFTDPSKRRMLAIGVAAAALLGGGWLALRSSPLASVQHIKVKGVHGVDALAIDAALESRARKQSTLDVSVSALREAVARYPVVRDLRVSTSFPHGLTIEVSEQLPVAVLIAGASRTAVAANGLVLGPALALRSLPTIHAAAIPQTGTRARGGGLQRFLTLLAAAPPRLAHLATRVFAGPQGLTVAMRDGMLVYFGDETRPHAKWASLAAVLSDPSSAGASYVDVRLPERPAARVPAGAAAAAGQVSASDPTAAALAASLAQAVGGGEHATTETTTPPGG